MAVIVRVYADICHVPNGVSGPGMSFAPIANLPGYGGSVVGGVGGSQPNAQTLRFQQQELVPGTMDAPTAANIGTALTTAATDLQAQLTAAVVAQIQGWATGGV